MTQTTFFRLLETPIDDKGDALTRDGGVCVGES